MNVSGIGKRYAVALFNAAGKGDVSEQVNGDIVSFANLLETNDQLRSFLTSPQVRTDAKKELVVSVLGERASGLFLKFVDLLIDKKRLSSIDEIALAYTQLYEENNNIIEVRCVTAVPLPNELEVKTRKAIEVASGKSVRLVTEVNPEIIGGMILFTANRIIDGSIRHKLNTMRKQLVELKVH